MELSGAEILLQSLADHKIDTIFGYPGSCVMQVLDKLYDHKEIEHILVRHEQGAVHAACGYAQLSQRPGVVLVTSGPGATNTITGIADAFYSEIPLLVITGQVPSNLLGTDAFQEADVISITASMTKWNHQIHKADQIADTVLKAFKIATSGRPGPVLLDITKDAQTGKAQYNRVDKQSEDITCNAARDRSTTILSDDSRYTTVLNRLADSKKDIVLVVDQVPNNFYSDDYFCSNKVIRSRVFRVSGFGLPAAIGAKYAVPDKTICLVVGSQEFQHTCKELGVLKQKGIAIKMILLNDDASKSRFAMNNPDFMQLVNAYGIRGRRITENDNLFDGIQEMLNSTGSYLLEIGSGYPI